MTGYREHRIIKIFLGRNRKIPATLLNDVDLSAESIEKAKEYDRDNIRVGMAPLPVKQGTLELQEKNREYFRYQQEIKLAKLLKHPLPDTSPDRILILPEPPLPDMGDN